MRGLALLALSFAACASPAPRPRGAVEAPPADRCHVLEDCYARGRDGDRDGCPDTALMFDAGSARLSPAAIAILREVVVEVRDVRPVALALIGSAGPGEAPALAGERARAARDWLAQQGVAATVDLAPDARAPAVWLVPRCRAPAAAGLQFEGARPSVAACAGGGWQACGSVSS
jgi:hypothetical protein